MSISVPAARLTPSNPGGPGLSGWRDPPRGYGVAPGARAETGSPVCQVKRFRAQSVLVQIAINHAERQGDRGRLHRLLRHAEALERDLDRRLTAAPSATAARSAPTAAPAPETV